MLLLSGFIAMALLMCVGFRRANAAPGGATGDARPAKGRVRTPWGPEPTARALPSTSGLGADFWEDLRRAIRHDPMVEGFLPRDDSATPRHGWVQSWLPGEVLTGSAWGPSRSGVVRRGQPGLRAARRGAAGAGVHPRAGGDREP